MTARINLRVFLRREAVRTRGPAPNDTAPVLVTATLPRTQRVADVHSTAGVAAVGLPAGYPLDEARLRVGHPRCQPIGQAVRDRGLRGIRCRSAQTPFGAGRELAWIPATRVSRAHAETTTAFSKWFWG